ncbi:MAG: EAL domain-containing protein [Oscillospiraceae bacterium]
MQNVRGIAGENMWHIDAEIISFLFMTVIVVDMRKTSTSISLKDRLFKLVAITTYAAIQVDIVSSFAITRPDLFSWWFTEISLVLYFLITPLLSVLWLFYSVSVLAKNQRKKLLPVLAAAFPYAVFAALVLTNPVTGWIFNLSAAGQYTRGMLFNLALIIFYGYALATIIYTCINFKKTERTTAVVLTAFPIIVGIGVCLQQIFVGFLFTGAAFSLVLLISYLFLQNKRRTRDSLTGLYNRLAFSDDMDRAAGGNERGYVAAVALDDFKLFNQTFGQEKGDELLRNVAEYLVGVSPSKTCYRYGGDIFTLILKEASADEVEKLANEILSGFKNNFNMQAAIGCSISASIGIVKYPHSSENKYHSIVTALDFAVFQAKQRGKGRIAYYSERIIEQLKRKHDVAEAIARGVEKSLFEVYLQPIFHTSKKTFSRSEALLRLNDEKLGFISPAEFVPIAEETGAIIEITYNTLDRVCSFLSENRHVLRDDFSISVNFSAIQFTQKDMVKRVIDIVNKYDISPSLVKIEVTESVILDSIADIRSAMTSLNRFGISFALDDYGQGYSNIAYLLNLPFDIVKLDKSIVDDIEKNCKFAGALVQMFRGMGKVIIAEGVETERQMEIIKSIGCDEIQGFYYAKPAPMLQVLGLFCAD